MRCTITLLFGVAIAASCKSAHHAELERYSRASRPLLMALREPSKAVLDNQHGFESNDAVIRACSESDDTLRQLASIEVTPAGDARYELQVPDLAEILIELRPSSCTPPASKEVCALFCGYTWTRLILAVEKLRVHAAGEGIEIVSLSP